MTIAPGMSASWSASWAWSCSPARLLARPGVGRNGSRFVPDSSEEAERKLRTAATHARDHQWSEAIEIYQRVIDQYGDKVVKRPKDEPGGDTSGDFPLYVNGRRFCHRCLAQLPPEARELYRGRADGLAERWFHEGARRRDMSLLRRVFDQAFCSSWGDDALELAGGPGLSGRPIRRGVGDCTASLVADRPGDPNILIHPDPSVDLAGVAAKKWLCRAAGEKPPTKADLDEFARRYPGAAGTLAGKKGTYATILAQALASDHLQTAGQARRPLADLRRFAQADSDRPQSDRCRPGAMAGRAGESLASNRNPSGFGQRNSRHDPGPRPSGCWPSTRSSWETRSWSATARECWPTTSTIGPAARTGAKAGRSAPAWKHDSDNGATAPQASRPYSAIPRYTLTAFGHRIYARMGTVSTTFPMRGRFGRNFHDGRDRDQLDRGPRLERRGAHPLGGEVVRICELPNRGGGSRSVNFEGTPIADAQNVYVGRDRPPR